MLFRRQKILLGLLSLADRAPLKIELVKWAFLLRQETALRSDRTYYNFLPYRFGPFSFVLYRDLQNLSRNGFLTERTDAVHLRRRTEARREFGTLPAAVQLTVSQVMARFGRVSRRFLLDYVYSNYPWFASRSELRPAPGNATDHNKPAVYTVGYEGESVDTFLQKLLRAGLMRVIDVRGNPVSRKYGFSKSSLSRLCSRLDLDYVHFRELGVPTSQRGSLKTKKDYAKLFGIYEKTILPKAADAKQEVVELIRDSASALMCFEADVEHCHRGRLARSISETTGLPIIHL